MDDDKIINLYWERSEVAILQTANKYGRYCHCISYNILHNVKFFNAFEESDFEAMEQYCTLDFINTVFHGDNVWGMKWAKVTSAGALVEDIKAQSAAVFVNVHMRASPASALYQGNEDIISNSFFLTLVQEENGTWLINGM